MKKADTYGVISIHIRFLFHFLFPSRRSEYSNSVSLSFIHIFEIIIAAFLRFFCSCNSILAQKKRLTSILCEQ